MTTEEGVRPPDRIGRMDDANLDLLQEETHLVGSAFNEYETAVNGNMLFNPSESLRTIDWHRRGSLLQFYRPSECLPRNIDILYHDDDSGSLLAVVDGLLTAEEVDQIRSNEWKRQHFHYNRGDRVIVIDEEFSDLLWSRLQAILSGFDGDIVSQPLGFGVSCTEWKIDSINQAMRINSYGVDDTFEPHRDAQFCESRRRRSVFSLVIYLTQNEGGETRFYTTEAADDLPSGPLTIAEELAFYASHEAELRCIDVKPVLGRCVLFTHDLIHESLPAPSERMVLRTDVVASSKIEPRFVDRQEVEDYRRALAYFTEAEQIELKAANFRLKKVKEYDPVDETYYHGNQFLEYQDEIRFLNEQCNEYFSKCMYLRYMYPRRLKARNVFEVRDEDFWMGLGQTVVHVMDYLPMNEAVQLTVIFPFLNHYMEALQSSQNKEAMAFGKTTQTSIKDLGLDSTTNRYYMEFSIQTDLSFHEHVEAWCRVATVLVAYKVSHASSSDKPLYCARFMPQTGEVVAIPLERLIYDAFHMKKSYGVVYAVRQQDQEPDAQADFEASVERGAVLRHHGLEFVGQNITEHFHVNVDSGPSTIRRRLNCMDGMLSGFPSKHEMNVLSNPKTPCRHVFVQVDTFGKKLRYGVTHQAQGSWRLTQDEVEPYKQKIVTNEMIFDFERYEFNVRREASWEGIEYLVGVSDMIKDIDPFYHAAAYHEIGARHSTIYRGGGSMKAKYLSYGGAESPFLDIAGSPSELRVKPTKREGFGWDVRVEWNGSFFPVTL